MDVIWILCFIYSQLCFISDLAYVCFYDNVSSCLTISSIRWAETEERLILVVMTMTVMLMTMICVQDVWGCARVLTGTVPTLRRMLDRRQNVSVGVSPCSRHVRPLITTFVSAHAMHTTWTNVRNFSQTTAATVSRFTAQVRNGRWSDSSSATISGF